MVRVVVGWVAVENSLAVVVVGYAKVDDRIVEVVDNQCLFISRKLKKKILMKFNITMFNIYLMAALDDLIEEQRILVFCHVFSSSYLKQDRRLLTKHLFKF